jgi:hypothetical protein
VRAQGRRVEYLVELSQLLPGQLLYPRSDFHVTTSEFKVHVFVSFDYCGLRIAELDMGDGVAF